MRIRSDRLLGNGGYLHKTSDPRPPLPVRAARPEPIIDVDLLMERWRHKTKPEWIDRFAAELGVKVSALKSLSVAWASEHKAFAFPMYDGDGVPCGIRLRYRDGSKRAVRGSHSGLFLPQDQPSHTALICEGATDTAAGLSLGYYAIGRPQATGAVHQTNSILKRLGVRRAIICADNDPKERPDGEPYNPGVDGAQTLQEHLCVPSCVLLLPSKDLRQFVNAGGSRTMLDNSINQLVWRQPNA